MKPFNLGHIVDSSEFVFQNVRSPYWLSAATILDLFVDKNDPHEAFVDILTGHFLKFSSDGIEVDKSCYSHRSFVIYLSASMYAPVLSLRVRHISYNASPTRQTCVFCCVLMIPWSFTENSPKMADYRV